MRKSVRVSETPATQLLRRRGVAFTEHVYDYVDHGGTAKSSGQLGVPENEVIKTLVMEDGRRAPGSRRAEDVFSSQSCNAHPTCGDAILKFPAFA